MSLSAPLPERKYDRGLNSEIERLLYQVSIIKMDAQGLAGELNDAQFNWTPAPARWSMAQCFDHLNITNRKWLPFFEESIQEGRARGALHGGPYSYGFLSRMFLRVVEPPARFKAKAPKGFQPETSHRLDKVMPEFVALHERVEGLLQSASGLDLASIKVQSAFSKRIRYSLGMGFWILTAHDRRHIWQARQLRNDPNFPKH